MMKISLKRKILFIFCLSCVLLFNNINEISAYDYEDISVKEAKNRIDANPEIFILDVRWASEFNDGHIQGAVNINVNFIFSNVDKLPTEKNTEIIVYCDNGLRSRDGAEKLIILDYTNVSNMKEGFNDWRKSGYPYIVGTNTIPTSDEVHINKIAVIFIGYMLILLLRKQRKNL